MQPGQAGPATIEDTGSDLERRLPELVRQFAVPGAAMSVRHGERTLDVTAGVHSLAEHVDTTPVTPDTVFEIGSVTKVWTATLVLQLVDEGLLDLDRPVRDALPELRLADRAAADGLTSRHLLAHAGGFEGDIFTDTGEDDDCLERYVAALATAPQYFPPGAVFSYSNAGYAVLGRLVEVLRGTPFDRAITDHIAAPLGLSDVHPQAAQVPAGRRATGHRWTPETRSWTATVDQLPRALAPAGTRLATTAGDLAAFGRAHCDHHDPALLSTTAVAAMATPQPIDVPDLDGQWPAHRGLGWEIERTSGATLVGHDGDTIGQTAFLRVVPDADLSLALLTNGGDARGLYAALVPHLLERLGRVGPTEGPPLASEPAAADLLGHYGGEAGEYQVTGSTLNDLSLHRTPKGLLAELTDPVSGRLTHVHGSTFHWETDRPGDPLAVAFGPVADQGGATYLHNGRAQPRLSEPGAPSASADDATTRPDNSEPDRT